LAEITARLLEPDEREAVLGDLAESGTSTLQGLVDVLDLLIRRQMRLWRDWQPWLATFGLAVPGSFLLMGTSLSVCLTFQRLIASENLGNTSPSARNHLVLLTCQALLLIAWSWTSGFVVGSVSRRTLWLNVALCALACLLCLSTFRVESLSRFCLLLFLLPAVIGVHQGVEKKQIALSCAILVAATVTVLMTAMLSVSGWSAALLMLLWPSWYMVATARRLGRGA
jgi:hypothetical protein